MNGGAIVEKASFYKLRGVVMFETSLVYANVLWRHESGLCVGGDIIVRSCRIQGGDMLVEVRR